MKVASSELETGLGRVDLRSGDRPDSRRTRALPADGDRTRRRGVPEGVPDAECAPNVAIGHLPAVELGVQPLSHALGPDAAFGAVGMSPEREQREVALRDDIGAVTRPPQLGERGVLPRRRLNPFDPRVQREHCSSRHAVLQAGPRCPPERLRALGHAFVERANSASERQDLLSRDLQLRLHRTRH